MTEKEIVGLRIRNHRTSLARRCRVLSASMIILASELESDKPHEELHVNELGEIQSVGTIIDAECGRLMGKIEVWGIMQEGES